MDVFVVFEGFPPDRGMVTGARLTLDGAVMLANLGEEPEDWQPWKEVQRDGHGCAMRMWKRRMVADPGRFQSIEWHCAAPGR